MLENLTLRGRFILVSVLFKWEKYGKITHIFGTLISEIMWYPKSTKKKPFPPIENVNNLLMKEFFTPPIA